MIRKRFDEASVYRDVGYAEQELAAASEEKLYSFIDFYRPQVQAYASEWEEAVGYKVKEVDFTLFN